MRETFDIFFRERFEYCADSPDDATPLQRTKDAGPDNAYNTDDGWDIVHYFDYTVDSQDDNNAAADDYDFQAGFFTESQQVKTLTLIMAMVPCFSVPFPTILTYRTVLI